MPGNTPNYDRYDVVRCFLRLNGRKSRTSLARSLDLGEGTMRAILGQLKAAGVVDANRPGHSLSAKGAKVHDRIGKLLEYQTVRTGVLEGPHSIAFLNRTSRRNRAGIQERDIAIRMGARAALILTYTDRLRAGGIGKLDTKPLDVLFDYRKNNTLVITSAYNKATAERAGLAVCESISRSLRNAFSTLC